MTPRVTPRGNASPRALTPRSGALVPAGGLHPEDLEAKVMMLERHFEDLESETIGAREEVRVRVRVRVRDLRR